MILYRSFLILCFLISAKAFTQETLDIVIDLDELLLFKYIDTKNVSPSDLITADEENYRVVDGAGVFLQSLMEHRESFFSGGTEERNIEALRKIKLPNNLSAYDLSMIGSSKPRIFSRKDLELENGVNVKDLRKVADDVNLDHAILIDDHSGFAKGDQKKNLVRGLGVYRMGTYYPESTQEISESPDDFFKTKNELVRLRGIIDLALEKSREQKISIRDALTQIQWRSSDVNDDGFLTWSEGAFSPELYRRGLKIFRKVDPSYNLIKPPKKGLSKGFLSCLSLLALLMI